MNTPDITSSILANITTTPTRSWKIASDLDMDTGLVIEALFTLAREGEIEVTEGTALEGGGFYFSAFCKCRCGQPAVNLGFYCSEQAATYSTPCTCCGHPKAMDTELFCSEECRDEAAIGSIMVAISGKLDLETCFHSTPTL